MQSYPHHSFRIIWRV